MNDCTINFAMGLLDGRAQSVTLPWDEVELLLQTHEIAKTEKQKKKREGILGGPLDVENGRRKDNISMRTMLTVDYDGVVGRKNTDIKRALREKLAGLTWAAHTTWKHEIGSPRFRLVLPLSEAVDGATHKRLVRYIVDLIGFGEPDPCSFATNWLMFLPTAKQDNYWARSGHGEFLDVSIGDAPESPQETRTADVIDLGDQPHPVAPQAASESSQWAKAAMAAELTDLRATSEGARNHRLNEAAFNLGQIVGGGWLDRNRVETKLSATALATGLGAKEIEKTIRSGLEKGMTQPRGPDTRNVGNQKTRISKYNPSRFTWQEPSDIPPRKFLYGNHLIRNFPSLTVSAGGIGKSSLSIADAVAMVTGLSLLGNKPIRPLRVWIWNGEDPHEEVVRRVVATCLHHKIDPAELDGRLFIDSGRDLPIKLAEHDRDGVKIAKPTSDALVEAIREHKIDVLILCDH